MKDCVSASDFSAGYLEFLITLGLSVKKNPAEFKGLQQGKTLASLFFEDSTRTRESHELAAHHLGMHIIGFSGTEGTSVKKGEPLADTARMYAGYGADVLVMRHGLEGAARFTADVLHIPVINAGDGSNGHPTQTLLDLMTIKESIGRLDDFSIALVGDLKYGRTVHSLLRGLQLCKKVDVTLIAPESLQMPSHFVENYRRACGTLRQSTQLRDGLHCDFLYMTRIQRERFPEGQEGDIEFRKVSGIYQLNATLLQKACPQLKVMHPLPRDKRSLEISLDVDSTPHALYLEQARNGYFLRMVLLDYLLQPEMEEGSPLPREEHLWQDLPIKDGQKLGERLLYRLDNGTLIDHIEAGKGLEVYQILGLADTDAEVVQALGIHSQRYGRKDVLAIHNVKLTPQQLWKLALISEHATVNFIADQRVVQKGKVQLPLLLEGLVECPNQRCVSAPLHQEYVPSKFYVAHRQPLALECYYCEKPVRREEITLR